MHYSPFRHSTCSPKGAFAFDLHVLATPPAFDLSQDQTLHLIIVQPDPNKSAGNESMVDQKMIVVGRVVLGGTRPGSLPASAEANPDKG